MNDDQEALNEFSGTVRLFPLPSLVLFPQALQPLHIFEPRYRELTADCLADDRLMAIVLLRPGWETMYEAQPAIEEVACLGRIVAHNQLPDGRYNLLLRGLSRARIIEEMPSEHLYRTANVELMNDIEPLPGLELSQWRSQLAEVVLPRLSGSEEMKENLKQLFESELAIGALCDIISFALSLPLESKQLLLSETDVLRRVEILIDRLKPRPKAKFPPDFSIN